MIYLDHNATSPLRPEVLEAMRPYLERPAGNPSSAHGPGRTARAAIERGRRTLAEIVGAQPSEIVFTSGGTEANNLALFGALADPGSAHLVVSPIEHASVLEPVRALTRRGARVTWLPVGDDGRIDPAGVAGALRPETALVSVGWANNEIGTIQPIGAIAAVCRAAGVPLHVDACQALGRVAITAAAAELCTVSAHKLGGPMGVGALIVRGGRTLAPLLHGGVQERGRRPGSENVAAIAGFAAAVTSQPVLGPEVAALRERLARGLATIAGVRRYSPQENCLPNTLHVGFAGVTGETLVAALDLEGVAVSVGSACAAGSGEPSHVLLALGVTDGEARSGVRFSLGAATTADEIDTAVTIVRRVVAHIRTCEGEGDRRPAVAVAGAAPDCARVRPARVAGGG